MSPSKNEKTAAKKKPPKPDSVSGKIKKTPKKEKKFKKGTHVYWIAKVDGVLRQLEGVVVYTIPKGKSFDNYINKINKKIKNLSVLKLKGNTTPRPEQSFIVAVTNKEGRSALYRPPLSRLEKKV